MPLISLSGLSSASAQASREYALKAVFLLNFTRFVEWPASAFPQTNSPIVIGVLGSDPFGRALDDVVKGEVVEGHPVIVERYQSMAELKPCQILFISMSEQSRWPEIRDALKGQPVLTVSEMENFAPVGGMIRLYKSSQNKIRLRINLDAVKAEHLKISSKLLNVSDVVELEVP
ncbi:MAG: YfiR family protein [Verrucomicrobiota bacterium]